MKIIGTGLTGLVGSRVVELLTPEFSFENLSLETGVDITDHQVVEKRLSASDAPLVWHFAAYTDVQGAEKEREKRQEGLVWKVNVEATVNIAQTCCKLGKHLLYLSTDYIFDGQKEFYTEEDQPNPQGWYAVTKYEGEKPVVALGELGLVVRISNPYRANPMGKRDFVHKIMDRLAAGQPITAPSDSRFNPSYTDDVAIVLRKLVQLNASGIYHAGGGGSLSQYEAARTICEIFGFDTALVSETTFEQFVASRAPFPKLAVLKNDKIEKLGVSMRTFRAGLTAIKLAEKVTQ